MRYFAMKYQQSRPLGISIRTQALRMGLYPLRYRLPSVPGRRRRAVLRTSWHGQQERR